MFKRARLNLFSVVVVALTVLITSAGCTVLVGNSPTPPSGMDVVDEAWGIISREYVDPGKVDSVELGRAAIKGMVDALDDPYSTYLDPEEYELNITHQQGTFGGIGATVGVRDGQIIVVAPIPGTPAATAGIKPGDAIVAVNGEPTEGKSIEQVVMSIRGPEGTSVKVTIRHEGQSEPVQIELVRAVIDVPSLAFEMRDSIAYVRIYFFSERTDEELIPVLGQLKDAGASGIVLDLRSNPGGPVDTGVNIASHFLERGVVVYLVDNAGRETSYPVIATDVTTTLPMVLLTDNYSASLSEVLAGALQDYGRAVVAGTTTFGKGSADRWFELSDGSAIYLTVSRCLTPNRRLIEGKGIEPDFKLDLQGDDLVQWAVDYLKSKQKVASRA